MDILTLILALAVTPNLVMRWWRKYDGNYDMDEWAVASVMITVVAITAVIIVILSFPFHLQGVITPEGVTVMKYLK